MNQRRFENTDDIYDWLLKYVNVEKGEKTEFRLDRMRRLAEDLGNPQDSYATVHVAGSKGKGSVSVMTASLLAATGLRCGLYTSPHLVTWTERIAIAGEKIPDSLYLDAAERVLQVVEGLDGHGREDGIVPTFFEATTLIAFLVFRLAGCSVAVIETGLGGRLDSTNIITPHVSILTPIELEHTEFLGNTIEAIAGEKAGIIKTGIPVICSRQRPEALEVFQDKAARSGSRLFLFDDLYEGFKATVTPTGTTIRLTYRKGERIQKESPEPVFPDCPDIHGNTANPDPEKGKAEGMEVAVIPTRHRDSEMIFARMPGFEDGYIVLESGMHGAMQAENLGTALMAVVMVLPGLDSSPENASTARRSDPDGKTSSGFTRILDPGTARAGAKRAMLPARFEPIQTKPVIILDGAHTPRSVAYSLESLKEAFPGPAVLLFACAKDKSHKEMAGILAGYFNTIFITKPGTFKESNPEAVMRSFAELNPATRLIVETGQAIRIAIETATSESATLLVAGSFYLCAEVRKHLVAC